MNQVRIFLVEDDHFIGEMYKYHLSLNPDYSVTLFQSGKELLNNLHQKPDIICIDYGLPDLTGDELFKRIQSVNKSIPIIVISGQEDISVALNFLKDGAKDYIVKDNDTKERLWNAILKIRENLELKQEVEELKEQLEQKYNFEKTIIGQSNSLKSVFNLIEKAVHSTINVSITGETGTGKEVIAKAIHFNGDRKKKSFIAVNMAAIPSELIESELFGHEKGAFTGANVRKIGKFEEANDGTIFLDEIAEMDINMQTKLLRVLQEREVVRVGGNETVKVNVRIITATHKNLAEEVKKGTFREDLYYRIIGLPIELPPLRDRGNDILILAKHFVEVYCKENKQQFITFSKDANDKLLRYNYPGNVRELKAIIDLACVMSDGIQINENDIRFNSIKGTDDFTTEEKTLKQYTNDIIYFYLKKYNNDVLEVAKRLDIGKSTIYNLLKNKEIEKKSHESS